MHTQKKHIAPHGFTMVELLTVVVILMILIGIGLVASINIGNTGNAQLTRATLAICDQILTEVQVARGKTPMIFNPNDLSNPKKNQFTTAKGKTPIGTTIPAASDLLEIDEFRDYAAHSIQRFVAATFSTLSDSETQAKDPVTRIYGTLSDQAFVLGTASVQDIEADNGTLHEHDFASDPEYFFLAIVDGWGNRLIYKNDPNDLVTNSANYPHDNFLPRRNIPFFASAGPDGAFGNANINPNTNNSIQKQLYDEAQDNLYSYETINP